MAITNFVSELWAAAVQLPFEKALVFGQPTVANRKYEGQIKQQGDAVNITSVAAPTIRTYDKTADITVEDVTDGTLKLVIDQGDYFAFRVNDIDKVQAAGDFAGPATMQAGTGLRDKVDRFIASLIEGGAASGNKVGRVKVVVGGTGKAGAGQSLPFEVLIRLNEKLNKQSVPSDGRYVVIPPEFLSGLLYDPRFTRVDASGSSEGLRNGIVGRALGFDVLVSNNVPTVGGGGANKDDLVIAAGVPDALTFANQLVEVEALREQARFADMVRGLNVYGAKVTRPEGLATATVQAFEAGTGVDTVVTGA
jgi:hypothetical protein